MSTFRYLTAAEWGGTWKRPPVREELHDPEVFIHHTAGNPMSNMTAEAALRALNAYATADRPAGKGYSFLDYDYLIHWERARDLFTIAEGRGEWLSAATADRNELGEAICVFGYFHPGSSHSAHPTPGHVEATALGIVRMIERGLVARDAKILGHYQNPAHPGATGCPGEWFIPHIPAVRSRVAELLNPEPQEEPPMQPYRLRCYGFAEQVLVDGGMSPLDQELPNWDEARALPEFVSRHPSVRRALSTFYGGTLTPILSESA